MLQLCFFLLDKCQPVERTKRIENMLIVFHITDKRRQKKTGQSGSPSFVFLPPPSTIIAQRTD